MKKTVIGYIIVVFLLLTAVWSFTRTAIFSPFDLSDKGTLGDAVNGLTAQIISLITAGLLYYSFQAQVKANELLSDNNQFETFTKILAQIKSDVEELEFKDYWTEKEANAQIKDTYDLNGVFYHKTFKGEPAMVAFSLHLERKIEAGQQVSWPQKEFIRKLVLVYEDIILLERFIDSAKTENAKYFYAKLNFFFQINFEYSFAIVYKLLKNDKTEFYYMPIRNLERVRFVLATYQALEQKMFIKQQEDLERGGR